MTYKTIFMLCMLCLCITASAASLDTPQGTETASEQFSNLIENLPGPSNTIAISPSPLVHTPIAQLEQAAQAGDPDAQYAMGYMYYEGKNLPEDKEAARNWIKRAAVQGQPQAMEAIRLIAPEPPPVVEEEKSPAAQPEKKPPAKTKKKKRSRQKHKARAQAQSF
jgi:TPR repeat protein